MKLTRCFGDKAIVLISNDLKNELDRLSKLTRNFDFSGSS